MLKPEIFRDRTNQIVFALMFLYIGANLYLFTTGIYWFLAAPFAALLIYLIFYQTDKAVLFLVFATPLSRKIDFQELGFSVSLPGEPIMALLLGLFLLKLILDGRIDRDFLRHPLTLAIFFNLLIVFLTALSSSMFFVSIKFFIARMWFVVVFYCIGFVLFKKPENFRLFVWLFCISMTGVIAYALRRHYLNDWNQNYANYAPHPFFPGHGDYAAVMSLFMPFLILFMMKRKVYNITPFQWTMAGGILLFFIAGTIFSFTRAAWLGIIVSLGFFAIYIFKIHIKYVALAVLLAGCVGLYYQNDIMMKLKDNKKVSASNFSQHVESIGNISTDASNTERINRWMCAFRMFAERPLHGWGPGTYMFQYAPFQVSHEMTIISTNAGNLGNAHSEYIGPLAESGVFGMLSIIGWVVFSCGTAIRLIYKGTTPFVRLTALGVILALITYFTHGTINNYLDTDKAAVPFFALMALLVTLDLHYNRKRLEM